jgi:hypothetical protein
VFGLFFIGTGLLRVVECWPVLVRWSAIGQQLWPVVPPLVIGTMRAAMGRPSATA